MGIPVCNTTDKKTKVDKELEQQKQIDLAHYKKKKLVREKSDE